MIPPDSDDATRAEAGDNTGGAGNGLNWRRWSALALVVLASLLLPAALAASWLDNQIRDTDRYVETMAPLSYNDAIADAVSRSLTDALFQQLEVQQTIRDSLPEKAGFLAGPLTSRLQDFTRETTRNVIVSEKFNKVWVEANRVAHSAVTGLLFGDGQVLSSQNGQVSLDLNPVVDDVKNKLDETGLDIFDNTSSSRIDLEFTLIQSRKLADIQGFVSFLSRLAWVLPFMVLASWVAAVWLSPDRRRTVAQLGAGVSLGMVALSLLLVVGRDSLLDSITAGGGSAAAAAALYDTLLRLPQSVSRWTFMGGLLVAVSAWLIWPSNFMARSRRTVHKWIGQLAANRTVGPVLSWIDANAKGLQLAGLFMALLIFVWWDWPSMEKVLTLGLVTAVYLVLVWLLGSMSRSAA